MTGLVINTDRQPLDYGWEANALRTALCLMDHACGIGPSVYTILYREIVSKMLVPARLKLLIHNEKDPEFKKQLEETAAILKMFRKRKHRTKQEIVAHKKLEKHVDDLFEQYIEQFMKTLNRFGLPQLQPFYADKDPALNLWFVEKGQGEKNSKTPLSRLLSFETEESENVTPDVMMFYAQPAQELLDDTKPTLLATLPNLNVLETEKLRIVRQRLQPMQQELEQELPLWPDNADSPPYYAGKWNLKGIETLAPKLQEAIDGSTELQWVKKIDDEFRTQLHVGNMDTPQLWQLLYDNRLIPEDTWKVLQKKLKKGVHCPTTAFMTITPAPGTRAMTDLPEDETLTHRRKTIDLN